MPRRHEAAHPPPTVGGDMTGIPHGFGMPATPDRRTLPQVRQPHRDPNGELAPYAASTLAS